MASLKAEARRKYPILLVLVSVVTTVMQCKAVLSCASTGRHRKFRRNTRLALLHIVYYHPRKLVLGLTCLCSVDIR